MKTVFFYYDSVLTDLYWKDRETVFFNQAGWWIVQNGSRNHVSPNELAQGIDVFDTIEITALIKEFRSWGPIWARWCGRGDQHEHLLREAAILAMTIAAGMRKLDIDVCVMHTGVSHHIDSVIFQIACRLAKVRTIFLYAEVLAARLIPLLQHGGVEQREILKEKISAFRYGAEIQEFLKTKQKDQPPKNNVKVEGMAKSWKMALPYLFCKDVAQLLRVWRRKFSSGAASTQADIFYFTNALYPFQFLLQGMQQKKALDYLTTRVKPATYFHKDRDAGRAPCLILAAHYQPEATSFPEGGDWGNHIDIAIEVFKKGYEGTLLYKEHPATSLYLEGRSPTRVGMSRSRKYYEQLEWVGCEFVETGFQLSINPEKNYWYLPITITGTIAIERSLAGFHTIVTGYPWFKEMPGVLQFSEIASFADIKPEWLRPDPEIARQAYAFLVDFLDERTLTNAPGIGTGKPTESDATKDVFAMEFTKMLAAARHEFNK